MLSQAEIWATGPITYETMTHVISTDLESETVCTFIAQVLDRYEDLLDTVVVECTIKGNFKRFNEFQNDCTTLQHNNITVMCNAASSSQVLPVVCEHNGGQCQCSCSPGFEGLTENHIDGNICELNLWLH